MLNMRRDLVRGDFFERVLIPPQSLTEGLQFYTYHLSRCLPDCPSPSLSSKFEWQLESRPILSCGSPESGGEAPCKDPTWLHETSVFALLRSSTTVDRLHDTWVPLAELTAGTGVQHSVMDGLDDARRSEEATGIDVKNLTVQAQDEFDIVTELMDK